MGGNLRTARTVKVLDTMPTMSTVMMNGVSLMTPEKYNTTSIAMSINSNATINNNAFFLFIVSFVLWLLVFLFWQALGFAKGLGDDPLQLAVGAAELVRSPGLNCVHRFRVHAQDETLGCLLSHNVLHFPSFYIGHFPSDKFNGSAFLCLLRAGLSRRHKVLLTDC